MATRYCGFNIEWDYSIYRSVKAKCEILERYLDDWTLNDIELEFKEDYPDFHNWYAGRESYFVKDTIKRYQKSSEKSIKPTVKDRRRNLGRAIQAARAANNSITSCAEIARNYGSSSLSKEAMYKYAERNCKELDRLRNHNISNGNDDAANVYVNLGDESKDDSIVDEDDEAVDSDSKDASDDEQECNQLCQECNATVPGCFWPVRCYNGCKFYAHYGCLLMDCNDEDKLYCKSCWIDICTKSKRTRRFHKSIKR